MYIILIIMLFIGMRGSLGTFPLKEDDCRISSFEVLNNLNTNPILAFVWALGHYKNDYKSSIVSSKDVDYAAKELFPILHTTKKLINFKQPHIVVNLMESFGSNILIYQRDDFNLLGSLKYHFDLSNTSSSNKSDFVFYRFISSTLGTAGSFSELYFRSPNSIISQGKFKNTFLKETPIDMYKNAGYEVIFITSGNGSWQNYGDYLKIQGVDKIYDMNYFISKYPKAKQYISSYGVLDEFIYDKMFDILNNANKPLFIFTLTTTNHPPYIKLPNNYLSFMNPNVELLEQISNKKEIINSYIYASDCFGEFLKKIKDSKIKDSVIIAATGDHRLRDLKIGPLSYTTISYAVPFYIYIPTKIQNTLKNNGVNIFYDPLRVGSHKDIFPTLYEFSLSNVSYYSTGGRNMLTKPKDLRLEFGMNSSIYINNIGVVNGDMSLKWANEFKMGKGNFKNIKEIILNTNETFEFDKDFKKKYDLLNKMQLDYRLNLKS
ncbi:LTA synthase family protein [Helicobacter sp. MIT 14-3879]|uniref:LTA synthase family protein n=1 Tax=Helicobacter sp. MIT 14-3879 TaxID=2040649 RepID=UPI0011C07638|nr:sulfatase-like hydrolase/transferase [Helicobacter sp. MIT 14-3879]